MGLGKFFKKAIRYSPANPRFLGNVIKDSSKLLGIGGGYGSAPGDGGGQAVLEAGYANAIANQTGALGSIPKAYDKARGSLASGKAANIQQVQDAGAVSASQVDQSMASRGLYNTTALDSARMGVGAQTSRQVAQINAQFDALEAELGLRQNAAENQIRSNIAGLNVSRGQAIAGHLTQQQQLAQQWALNNNPDAWLDSILGIAGTAIGYGIAGPAGGAVGGHLAGNLSSSQVGHYSSLGING